MNYPVNPDDIALVDYDSVGEIVDTLKKLIETNDVTMIMDLQKMLNSGFEKNDVEQAIKTLLETAVTMNRVFLVKRIIEVGKVFVTESTFYPAIESAYKDCRPESLKILLDNWHSFNFGIYTNHLLLHNIIREWNKDACNYEQMFDMLLEHPAINLNQLNTDDHSVMCCATRRNHTLLVKKLLKKNVFLGSLSNKSKLTTIDVMNPEMLEEHFDGCIKKVDVDHYHHDADINIKFDYTCLKPSSASSGSAVNELDTINCIASNKKLRYLIQHPLIVSFLMLKWFPLMPIFYFNLLWYCINFVMLTAYMAFYFGTINNEFIWVPLYFSLSILIREFFPIILLRQRYLTSLTNYIELALIGLTGLVYCDRECFELDSNRRAVGAVASLIAALELMILLGTIPTFSLSLHMGMLKKVSVSFLQVFAFYAVILVGFASSFFTLFGFYGEHHQMQNSTYLTKGVQFSNPGFAVFKTILMFNGNLDPNSLHFEFSDWMGYIIFLIFIFAILNIMMNLLRGLAISDIKKIMSDAALYDWIERAKLLKRFETTLLDSKTLAGWIPEELKSSIFEIQINYSTEHVKLANLPVPIKRGDSVVSSSFRGPPNSEPKQTKGLGRFFRWFMVKFFNFDFKIVQNSLKILEKCTIQKQKEAKKENKNNETKQRLESMEEKLNKLLNLSQVVNIEENDN